MKKIKRVKNLSMALILLTMFSISLFAKATIKFKETIIDFGESESGKVIDVQFEFENLGDEMLLIKNVSTSCGCTAAKLEKKEYQPGEKGVIPVKFFTQGYTGKVSKTITVSTNDKDNIYTRLRLDGNLKLTNFAKAELAPDKIDFGEVKLGEKYTQKIMLKNTGTIDLKVVEITHAPEMNLVFKQIVVPPGEEAEIEIILTPMDQGKFFKFLKIRTNAYRQSLVIARVNAAVLE